MKPTQTGQTGMLAVLGWLLLESAALAHPRLVLAGPAPGSTVAVSPKIIRIQFSEALELKFTGIEVKNKAGIVQPVGPAALDAKDQKLLIVPLTSPLVPGTYTVTWHTVGDDTHRQTGHYDFTVKP